MVVMEVAVIVIEVANIVMKVAHEPITDIAFL